MVCTLTHSLLAMGGKSTSNQPVALPIRPWVGAAQSYPGLPANPPQMVLWKKVEYINVHMQKWFVFWHADESPGGAGNTAWVWLLVHPPSLHAPTSAKPSLVQLNSLNSPGGFSHVPTGLCNTRQDTADACRPPSQPRWPPPADLPSRRPLSLVLLPQACI